MKLSDFDFTLPEDRIALRPAEPRDSARLLVVADGALEDRRVSDLPAYLKPGDVLVFNDTRVIPARLNGVRTRGDSVVAVEATLHRRRSADRWTAFMKPGKRLKPGDRVRFGPSAAALDATVIDKGDGCEVTLGFDLSGPDLDAERPPEPELHVEPKRPPHKRPESPSRLPVILALVASAVVLAALLGGLVFARAEVMRLWEPSKRLFGWLGLA